MTSEEVTLEQLLEAREQLFRLLPATLDDAEREFLLAVNRREPSGELLGLPGIENLPAIRWKLLNLGKLAKSNPKKYRAMVEALEVCLTQRELYS